jgi:hypothetical protein
MVQYERGGKYLSNRFFFFFFFFGTTFLKIKKSLFVLFWKLGPYIKIAYFHYIYIYILVYS